MNLYIVATIVHRPQQGTFGRPFSSYSSSSQLSISAKQAE